MLDACRAIDLNGSLGGGARGVARGRRRHGGGEGDSGVMSPSLRILNAATGLVLLAAVIFAEGGVRAVLAEPALVAFLLVSLALFAAANFTQGNLSSGVREARDNRWVIAAFTVLGLGLIAVCVGFDRADIGTIDGSAVRWLGVALYTVGGVLRLAPVFALGRRFSALVAIQQGHRLVTGGLYAHVRHPSYLGLLVNAVGLRADVPFAAGPHYRGADRPVPLIARMDAEERLLEETFGEEYRAYRARTARLIPGVY